MENIRKKQGIRWISGSEVTEKHTVLAQPLFVEAPIQRSEIFHYKQTQPLRFEAPCSRAKGPSSFCLFLRPTPKSVPASHYLFSFSFTLLHAERSSLRTSRSHFSTCVRERERECKREREKKRNARRSLSLPGQTHARGLTKATR